MEGKPGQQLQVVPHFGPWILSEDPVSLAAQNEAPGSQKTAFSGPQFPHLSKGGREVLFCSHIHIRGSDGCPVRAERVLVPLATGMGVSFNTHPYLWWLLPFVP